jgi:hypothetical protein
MADTNATIPGPPPGFISDPSDNHQADIISSAVITWLIGAIFVGLRFYARGWLLKNALGVEDWLIAVALVFSAATSAGKIERESLVTSQACQSPDANPHHRGLLRLGKAFSRH